MKGLPGNLDIQSSPINHCTCTLRRCDGRAGCRYRPGWNRQRQVVHRLSEADAHHVLAAQLGHLGRGGRAPARHVQWHRERQGRGGPPGVLLLGRPDHQSQGRHLSPVHEHLGGHDRVPELGELRELSRREHGRRAGAVHAERVHLGQRLAPRSQRRRPPSFRTASYAVVVSEVVPFTIYQSSSLDGPWTCVRRRPIQANGVRAGTDTHYDSNVSLTARARRQVQIVQRHGLIAIADTLCGPYKMQTPTWTYPAANLPQGIDSIYPHRTSVPDSAITNPTYAWEEDPHIWYSGGVYHVLYSGSGDRIGWHLYSTDGIHDWKDDGLAFDPRMYQKIFCYEGSTTCTQWYKMERPSVVLEDGHVTHVTWAVADVDKDNMIPAGSNHGSKVIVVPFDGVAFDKDYGVGGSGGGAGGATGTGGTTATGGQGGRAGAGGRGGTAGNSSTGTGGSATGGTSSAVAARVAPPPVARAASHRALAKLAAAVPPAPAAPRLPAEPAAAAPRRAPAAPPPPAEPAAAAPRRAPAAPPPPADARPRSAVTHRVAPASYQPAREPTPPHPSSSWRSLPLPDSPPPLTQSPDSRHLRTGLDLQRSDPALHRSSSVLSISGTKCRRSSMRDECRAAEMSVSGNQSGPSSAPSTSSSVNSNR